MGFSDVWNRTLVYFGIAEEEDWDEDGYATNEELERSYGERPNVRRLSPRRQRQPEFEEWTDDAAAQTQVVKPERLRRVPPTHAPHEVYRQQRAGERDVRRREIVAEVSRELRYFRHASFRPEVS
jgi:hypothetical protein